MQKNANIVPGTFCWVDLGTTDPDGAKKFYNEIFGWDYHDEPAGEGMVYTMCLKDGKNVGALYLMNEQQKQMNIPPHWMSYVAAEDAAETVKKAGEAGGNIIMEVFDVMESGKMGMIQDPDGAMLAIWQTADPSGAFHKNIPGAICWIEMGSKDPSKAIPFFEKVFGWKANTEKSGEMEYTTFMLGGEMVGGLYVMPDTMEGIPPHWMPYFLTEDIDMLLDKAQSNGGALLMPKGYAEDVGHFAVIRDPQGAAFGVVQGENR